LLCEAVISVPLMLVFVGSGGLFGVTVAVAFSVFLVRGLFQLLYGCRLLKVSLLSYCKRVFVPVTIFAIAPIGALYAVAQRAAPESFGSTFLLGAAYCVVYVGVMGVTLVGPSRLRRLVSGVRQRSA
jgi:hypothetical protein